MGHTLSDSRHSIEVSATGRAERGAANVCSTMLEYGATITTIEALLVPLCELDPDSNRSPNMGHCCP